MATKAFSDLYEPLRVALGDEMVEGSYDYQDAQLLAALRSVVAMGLHPGDLAVDDQDQDQMNPGPVNADQTGYLVIQAALLLVGGDTPYAMRTRGMSVTVQPKARRDTIEALYALAGRLEEKGKLTGVADEPVVLAEDPLTGISTTLREAIVEATLV